MRKKTIEQIIVDEFSFLKNEYAFKLMNRIRNTWGVEFEFANYSTGVILNYEFREAYLQIFLYKLKNGKIIKNPRNIDDATRLIGFCLDDILSLRNPKVMMNPTYEYEEQSEYFSTNNGMNLYIKKFTENLKVYASDILRGDFSIFPQLEKIVKKRAKAYSKKEEIKTTKNLPKKNKNDKKKNK